jgi:hypothetical protein
VRLVARYRQFAEECRQLAGKLNDAEDRRAIEMMAMAWEKIADEREASLTDPE